jgi:CPA2 family monovalent cation:H+ antiporter-2
MGWQTALALSGAMAMSSTAIVVKLMAERAELERARPPRDGHSAVPGSGRGAAADLDSGAGLCVGTVAARTGLALLKAVVLVGLLLWAGSASCAGG